MYAFADTNDMVAVTQNAVDNSDLIDVPADNISAKKPRNSFREDVITEKLSSLQRLCPRTILLIPRKNTDLLSGIG